MVDGSRRGWRCQLLFRYLQPFFPCPIGLAVTTAREPIGCVAALQMGLFVAKIPETPHVWPSLRAVFLDSGPSAAISPAPGAGIPRAACFCADFQGIVPRTRGIESITTEEKAGPDPSEAGIEHEGIKRCSQSSKPAAGSTASFRMMCSR